LNRIGGLSVWVVSNFNPRRDTMKRFALFAGSAVLGLSALTACGGDNTPAAPQNTTTTSTSSSPSSSGEAKLALAEVANYGKIVVDGKGRTLYIFDKDTASPSKSNCEGGCLVKWPALMAGSGTPQVDGVDASLVGTVDRSDGSKQVTLAGWPLYYFQKDTKAGDATGQAVGGIWWVVGADGKKITTKPSASGGGGY
jgi:predicted lipoprotein with Yx(FWY)xxD motif